jgi:hypothetical protein
MPIGRTPHTFSFGLQSASHGRRNLRLGVVGLGAGTIAAYGRLGDSLPRNQSPSRRDRIQLPIFTFLADSPASIKVILGDARLSLEHESDRGELQDFDLLAIDPFNGDAIPVHLFYPGSLLDLHSTLEQTCWYSRHPYFEHLSGFETRYPRRCRSLRRQRHLGTLAGRWRDFQRV